MKGLYETAERELVQAFIRPGDQILEIGASIGIVTCFLAHRAGDNATIVSVEPDASLRPYFERQLRLNGIRAELLHALCCPLWNQSIPQGLASRHFVPDRDNLCGGVAASDEAQMSVRWITAESACSETGLQPSALVVDVEGTESVWTDHPPNFPESLSTVILEVHPHLIGIKLAGKVVQAVVGEGFQVAGIRNNVFAFQR